MVLVSYSGRELNAKLVYYGPGLSGKTTNLEYIYASIPQMQRGKMVSMKTKTERTLFFDFLPVNLGELSGFKTRFLLYTVPGQVYYNATRKLVLKGVDAVVFVADSGRGKMEENIESLDNLKENLREHGCDLETIPWVIQYNKRDLSEVYTIEELDAVLNTSKVPSFEAVAMDGRGVVDTFKGVSRLLLRKLARDIGVALVAPPPPVSAEGPAGSGPGEVPRMARPGEAPGGRPMFVPEREASMESAMNAPFPSASAPPASPVSPAPPAPVLYPPVERSESAPIELRAAAEPERPEALPRLWSDDPAAAGQAPRDDARRAGLEQDVSAAPGKEAPDRFEPGRPFRFQQQMRGGFENDRRAGLEPDASAAFEPEPTRGINAADAGRFAPGVADGSVPGVADGSVPGVADGSVPGVAGGSAPGVADGFTPQALYGPEPPDATGLDARRIEPEPRGETVAARQLSAEPAHDGSWHQGERGTTDPDQSRATFSVGERIKMWLTRGNRPESMESADPAYTGESPRSEADTPATLADTPPATGDTPATLADTPPALVDTPATLADTPPALVDRPVARDDTPAAMDDTPVAREATPDVPTMERFRGANGAVENSRDAVYPFPNEVQAPAASLAFEPARFEVTGEHVHETGSEAEAPSIRVPQPEAKAPVVPPDLTAIISPALERPVQDAGPAAEAAMASLPPAARPRRAEDPPARRRRREIVVPLQLSAEDLREGVVIRLAIEAERRWEDGGEEFGGDASLREAA